MVSDRFSKGSGEGGGLGKYGRGAARARNPPKSRVWDRFSTESGEGARIREIWPWRRQGQESSEIKGLG